MEPEVAWMFIKAFNADLTGYGGFQFEVGQTYETDTDDNWRWFHYTASAAQALRQYNSPDTRFCEVESMAPSKRFRAHNTDYYTTAKLRIVREISRDDVLQMLMAERCPFYLLTRLDPPYDMLASCVPARKSFTACADILNKSYLTIEQRKSLLPKKYHKYLEVDYE